MHAPDDTEIDSLAKLFLDTVGYRHMIHPLVETFDEKNNSIVKNVCSDRMVCEVNTLASGEVDLVEFVMVGRVDKKDVDVAHHLADQKRPNTT